MTVFNVRYYFIHDVVVSSIGVGKLIAVLSDLFSAVFMFQIIVN